MNKRTRDTMIRRRAQRYLVQQQRRGWWYADTQSYESGYRAAIRDMRKAIAKAPKATAADDCMHVHEEEAIQEFLR